MMLAGGLGLAEVVAAGPGLVGIFGVKAMPRGLPASPVEINGSTFPVANASNSISSALLVLGL